MVKNFCDALEKAGYWAGLYMSRSPFTSYIDDSIRNRYALWLAEYNSKLNYSGSYGMWQNSSGGAVDGISGRVDTDYCYIDYPAQIKSAGLNGYTKAISAPVETPIPAKSTTENKSAAAVIQIGDDIYKGTLTKA
jgi:GH25 family lysozyme M1 (1,4-beta-N-acetylmuramidase)